MAKPTEFTVYLLRAGGTSWDADRRLIGQTDLPMTEQTSAIVVEAVRNAQIDAPVSLVLTSDEEAAMAAAKLMVWSSDTKLKSLPAMANVGLGLWEGVLREDLEERCPSAYTQWNDHPERITPPEGESFFDAQDRLIEAITKAMAKAKGSPRPRIAIVLRPLAWALVRSWLMNEKLTSIWPQLREPIAVERFEVAKSQLEAYQSGLKASA